ncbi:MAG: hypothetical protein ABJ004_19265 [Cyclobacteriaceae bacterium]
MKKVVLLLQLLLSLSSCREDDFDVLPAVTQEGLNTFGCLIDWEVLVPKDASRSSGGRGADGMLVTYRKDSFVNSYRPPYFDIRVINYIDQGGDFIYLYVPSLGSRGSYTFKASNRYMGIDSPHHPHAFAILDTKEGDKTYLSYYNSGEIEFTVFDTLQTQASGTFSLSMVDEDTGLDTIEIRDGRFDINWRTLNCGKTLWHQPCP